MNREAEDGLTCSQFLDRHTEYRDGYLDEAAEAAMGAHLSGCSSCARYDRVIEQGVSILRSLEVDAPRPVPVGTAERLALDAELGARTSRGLTVSRSIAAAAVLVAAILAAAASAPGAFLGGPPELDLAPVVATAPIQGPTLRPGYFSLPAALPFEMAPTGFHTLSRSLLHRYRGAGQATTVAAAAPQLD